MSTVGTPAAAEPPRRATWQLGRRRPRHKARRGDDLGVLRVNRGDPADRLLAGLAKVEMRRELRVLAERQLRAGPHRGFAVGGDRPRLHRRGTAADRTRDAVSHRESRPRGLALTIGCSTRPGVDRARHRGQLRELVAAIGHAPGKV